MHWLIAASQRLAGTLPAVFSLAGVLALTAAGLAWHAGFLPGSGACLGLAGLAFFLVGCCERDRRRWNAVAAALGPAPRISLRSYARGAFFLAGALWLGLAGMAIARADLTFALGFCLLGIVSQQLGRLAGVPK